MQSFEDVKINHYNKNYYCGWHWEPKLDRKLKTHHCSWWKCANLEKNLWPWPKRSCVLLSPAAAAINCEMHSRQQSENKVVACYEATLYIGRRSFPWSGRISERRETHRECAPSPICIARRFTPPVRRAHRHRTPLGPPRRTLIYLMACLLTCSF
jgi:hypothetical protein